jgi:flagellar biosynthesis chaperone FliJ
VVNNGDMNKQFQNDDFNKLYVLMTKEFDKVYIEFDKVHDDIGDVKKTLDHVIGEYSNLTDEQTALAGANIRVDDTLDNHEKRIKKLELQAS